jgi:hypothetical protein
MILTLKELSSIIQEVITTASLGSAVVTPLGTGPNYPNLPFKKISRKNKKKRKIKNQ